MVRTQFLVVNNQELFHISQCYNVAWIFAVLLSSGNFLKTSLWKMHSGPLYYINQKNAASPYTRHATLVNLQDFKRGLRFLLAFQILKLCVSRYQHFSGTYSLKIKTGCSYKMLVSIYSITVGRLNMALIVSNLSVYHFTPKKHLKMAWKFLYTYINK